MDRWHIYLGAALALFVLVMDFPSPLMRFVILATAAALGVFVWQLDGR